MNYSYAVSIRRRTKDSIAFLKCVFFLINALIGKCLLILRKNLHVSEMRKCSMCQGQVSGRVRSKHFLCLRLPGGEDIGRTVQG